MNTVDKLAMRRGAFVNLVVDLPAERWLFKWALHTGISYARVMDRIQPEPWGTHPVASAERPKDGASA